MGDTRKQVWYVSVTTDEEGREVARKEFCDGTSEENYAEAEREFDHMLEYSFKGFWTAPNLSMYWIDEDGERLDPGADGFDARTVI